MLDLFFTCENVMNSQNVAKWCSEFPEGRYNVHDEIRSRRPFFVTNEITEKTEEMIRAANI